MIFSNDELHIILNYRNLEMCEHSSFLIIDVIIVFLIKRSFPNSKITKLSLLIKPIAPTNINKKPNFQPAIKHIFVQ